MRCGMGFAAQNSHQALPRSKHHCRKDQTPIGTDRFDECLGDLASMKGALVRVLKAVYSVLNARIGSIFAARLAGSAHAARAMAISIAEANPSVTGSSAEIL